MSKKQKKKNHPFKADWKAYMEWRDEAEARERKSQRKEGRVKSTQNKKRGA